MGENNVSDKTFLAGMRDLASMAKQMAAPLKNIADSMKGLQADLRALRKHLELSPRTEVLNILTATNASPAQNEETIHD